MASPGVGGKPPVPKNTCVLIMVCLFPKTDYNGQLSGYGLQTHRSVVSSSVPVPFICDMASRLDGVHIFENICFRRLCKLSETTHAAEAAFWPFRSAVGGSCIRASGPFERARLSLQPTRYLKKLQNPRCSNPHHFREGFGQRWTNLALRISIPCVPRTQ